MNLNQLVGQSLRQLLDKINAEYIDYGNRVSMACPIHKGEDKDSCCIYTNVEFPYWKCFSRNCHEEGKGLVRLFTALLDKNYFETKNWLESIVGPGESVDVDRYSFICENRVLESRSNSTIMSREDFLCKTNRPSQYFIDRGFSPNVVNDYDIGEWKVTGEIVIPVYDESRDNVIGYIERSPWKRCCLCDLYHNFKHPCPTTKEEKMGCRKWKNSFSFYSDQTFFNLWFAKPFIKKTNSVVLVEGQGDVLRLVSAGIKNCLGMFGVDLKPGQRKLLDKLGVQNIFLFLDPDDAGKESSDKIEESLGRYYNFYRIESEFDPGDSSEEVIKDMFHEYNHLCW